MNRPVATGLAAVAAGLIFVATGRQLLPVELGTPVAVLIGIVAAVAGSVGIGGLLSDQGNHWEPTGTESGIRVASPGDQFEDLPDPAFRRRLRARVERSLIRTGYSRTDARARVARGDWTDDRLAAAYLGDDPLPVSRVRRLLDGVTGRSVADRARRRVLAELRRLRDDGPDE